MDINNIVALTFLILGLGFIITLFRSLFNVIGMKKTIDNFNGMMIIKAFSLPILCFVGLVVFVLVILPRLS